MAWRPSLPELHLPLLYSFKLALPGPDPGFAKAGPRDGPLSEEREPITWYRGRWRSGANFGKAPEAESI